MLERLISQYESCSLSRVAACEVQSLARNVALQVLIAKFSDRSETRSVTTLRASERRLEVDVQEDGEVPEREELFAMQEHTVEKQDRVGLCALDRNGNFDIHIEVEDCRSKFK